MSAKIHYYDIGDYLSREDKLNIIKRFGSIECIPWTIIEPNEHGDWINHRNEMFNLFIPIEPEKKFAKGQKAFFETYSLGLATGRDDWAYNYSKQDLKENCHKMALNYNSELERYKTEHPKLENIENWIDPDPHKISWNRNLKQMLLKNSRLIIKEESFTIGTYRPYVKQHLYFERDFNAMLYQNLRLFPTSEHKNLVICVSGVGASKDFSALITDCIPCLDLVEKSQCFPLYWYNDSASDIADLFNQGSAKSIDRYVRKDGVTDWILREAQKQYGYKVTKEDIFYYVYGILHSPDYRTTFATDLKKSLPRLPLVEKSEDFWAFSKAGRELAALHLNYETIEPYKGCIMQFGAYTNKGEAINYRVEKMRFVKKDSKTTDKSIIHYNEGITIEGIPAEAYEYVVNGKSAVEWIMERYAITTDKKSGITNDPNNWAREHNDEKYIFNLLLRIINVSVQTVEIVKGLPKLKFEK